MPDNLAELLGLDPNDPDLELATSLVEQSSWMRRTLVAHRISQGLTPRDFLVRLGWSAEKLAHFERYDSDPRLSDVTRYALVLGALVTHTVSAGSAGTGTP